MVRIRWESDWNSKIQRSNEIQWNLSVRQKEKENKSGTKIWEGQVLEKNSQFIWKLWRIRKQKCRWKDKIQAVSICKTRKKLTLTVKKKTGRIRSEFIHQNRKIRTRTHTRITRIHSCTSFNWDSDSVTNLDYSAKWTYVQTIM